MAIIEMHFKIIGGIHQVEVIATGNGIRDLNRLNKVYGKANWRKLKGMCTIELHNGAILKAEVHCYEGHGLGKKEIKLKRYL